MRVHNLKAGRFSDATGVRLQKEGSQNPLLPCVLYRLEDVEDFTGTYVDYWERDYLSKREAPPSPAQLEDDAKADFLLRGFDQASMRPDPAIIYCPGEHRLEYNMAWITGVARVDKPAFLLSLPTRQNCLRSTDNTAMSAFAYEIGALHKLGYKPQLSSVGEVFLEQPVQKCNAALQCVDCIPSYNDVKNALGAIQKVMFPEIVQCAIEVADLFSQLHQATNIKEIEFLDTQIKKGLERFKNDSERCAAFPNRFTQFQLAKSEDYSDMMSSVFISAFSDRLLHSPTTTMTPEESNRFLIDTNCIELPDGASAHKLMRNPTPGVIILMLNQKREVMVQAKQLKQIAKPEASATVQMRQPSTAGEDANLPLQAEKSISSERKRKREEQTTPDSMMPPSTDFGVIPKR